MFRIVCITVFGCLICTCCWAQKTTIKGRVTDEDTKEGIPFGNVYFEGTTTGTSTDVDGYYELTLNELPSDSLSASALGYKAVVKPIKQDSVITINFLLPSDDLTLQEVVVLAGENPANEIVRNIIKNKEKNRIEALDTYQYEQYSKTEIDLENLPENFRKSKLLKPFEFIFDNIDSTSDEKPFLPAYINEEVSDIYYVKTEGKKKKVPVAQRTSGVNNQSIIDFIGRIHQDFSIYDDWIYVVEKPFASPFSKSGLFYYEYYIIDSTYIEGKWSHKLKFKPKRKQENTFYGDFWVADTTFAIQRLNMRMSPDVNINFVDRIIVYQEFGLKDSLWLPETQKMVVDFKATEGSPGVIGRRTETFKDYRVNEAEIRAYYQKKTPNFYTEELEKNEDYWQEARHEPLTKNEAAIYKMVDSIKNVPIFKTYVQVLETVFTGYYEIGKVEVGPYFSIYSNNPVEGNRVRIGLRNTESAFNGKARVGGYLAYGFRDQDFKYGASLKWLISKRPRLLVGAEYINDISLNSESSEDFVEGDLFSGTLRRNILQKLIRIREGKLLVERFWGNGFSNRVVLLHRSMDPYGNLSPEGFGFNYAFLPDPNSLSDIDTTISTTEFIFKTRFAKDENFLDGNINRVSLGSKRPIVELQYTWGVRGILGSEYDYHKLSLYYRHYFYMNPIGWMAYRFKFGKTFGTVPFLLMEVHPGNEGFVVNRGGFNMMNRYEFASDLYATMVLEHHFDGFLFNKIPWVRKLDLRAVAAFKAVIGTITDANRNANSLNLFDPAQSNENNYSGFRAPDNGPYMETSVGIENIFKVFRVDAIWRLSYLDNPEAAQFGVRVGVNFFF